MFRLTGARQQRRFSHRSRSNRRIAQEQRCRLQRPSKTYRSCCRSYTEFASCCRSVALQPDRSFRRRHNRLPQGWDWFYLFLIGVFSQLGQIFLTNALQREPIAGVAIINYTGLIYALTIGWFVFGEGQGLISLAGMLLVVVGVLFSVLYGRRRRQIEELETTAA